MKKIVLLCNMGLSTSALMKKMREHAASTGLECEINAYPAGEVEKVAQDADCILIGPQISFQLDAVKKKMPTKPVECIDMKTYGMLDGAKAIAQAKKLMGE